MLNLFKMCSAISKTGDLRLNVVILSIAFRDGSLEIEVWGSRRQDLK